MGRSFPVCDGPVDNKETSIGSIGVFSFPYVNPITSSSETVAPNLSWNAPLDVPFYARARFFTNLLLKLFFWNILLGTARSHPIYSDYLHLGSQNDQTPRDAFLILKTCIEHISNFCINFRGTSLPNCTCSAMFEANIMVQRGECGKIRDLHNTSF